MFDQLSAHGRSGVALRVMVSTNDRDELAQNHHHLDADNFDTLDQFPATGQD
jgi:hypothetical protein